MTLDLKYFSLVSVCRKTQRTFRNNKERCRQRPKSFYVSEVDAKDREQIRAKVVETQKNAIIVASLRTFSTILI